MTVRWKTGQASCAGLLACVIGSSIASADDVVFIVNGTLKPTPDCQARGGEVKGMASTGNRSCGLYWGRSQSSGSRIASGTTKPDGKFKLIPDGPSKTLRDMDLRVVCLPKDDIPCWSHQLAAADYSLSRNNLTIADIELTCTSAVVGGAPAQLAGALAALAETHALLVWAGEEKLDAADAALKQAVARADKALDPAEREQLKAALAASAAPLRGGSRRGLPLLPSLQRDDFAEELIAAAPGLRWLTKPEPDGNDPLPYGERDGRFEGNVVHRVGWTFGGSLVSLSEGPLVVDPETQASLELTWPASAGPRVCLESRPLAPGIRWGMREAAAAGSASFTWDLASTRNARVQKATLGIVARSCADADHEQGSYIPVRAGTATPRAAAYRLVFLFPRQLTTINVEVFQGDGASRRSIALPDGAIQFDPDAQAPMITIDVPIVNLVPGLVHLTMSGEGAGRFDPERLSFIHAQRAGR